MVGSLNFNTDGGQSQTVYIFVAQADSGFNEFWLWSWLKMACDNELTFSDVYSLYQVYPSTCNIYFKEQRMFFVLC